ncbi:uncharacterized protein LOC125425633 [Sphaerodactylus townsendi]|uniref:uncharacterized protein LOC125425633 n=1 Tax=Sphaerodactylus townsendi TaxID=933632 RepID=UPI0020266495|nr:uncharacterized protein LOC125425633 [Sphaerodactylus townsendi]
MELEEHVRILKMTKQQLQEECQKQNISCENKSVDEMKALLLSKLMAAGAASALTTQTSPSPNDAVRIQELELEKLRLQAEKEIELQRLRIQEEQRKEVQRQEDREARRREREWEEKMLERKEKMQQEQRKHDLEMLRLQEESSRKINVTPKDFAQYREGEDPSIYLANFEKAAMQWGIAEAQYMSYLCSILTGELAAIYHSMPRADGGVTFKDFKATVLKRFKLGADHFRKQFRVLSPQQCKTYSEYVVKMSEMGRRWVEEAKAGDFESLFQLLVLDQLYSKLPKELKCLVKDKRPKNATEASEIADELVLNREGLDWRTSQLGREGKGFQRGGKAESQPKREGAAAPAEVKKAPDSANWNRPQVRKCFICEGTDHLRAACPQLQVKTSKPPPKAPTSPKVKERVAVVNHECLFTTMEPAEAWGDYVEPVRLRDQLVLGYADTGSSVTLVRADLVSESDILPNTSFKIQGIGGSLLTVPVAWMPVEWRGLVGLTEMGVMKDQPYPVLIGRDLLGGQYSVNVVTPSQTQSGGGGGERVSEETRTPPARGEVGAPGTTGEGGAQITQEGEGKPISETEGGVSQKAVRGGSSPPTQLEAVDLSGKEEYLSCSGGEQTEVTGRGGSSPQVQQEAEGFEEAELEGAEAGFGSEEQIAECLGAPEGFLKEVQCDPSLEQLRQVAIDQEVEFSEALSEQVVWKQGRLYRLWLPQGRQVTGDAIRQLVVPRKYRRRLMELAHDIPCAGHLGINKTRQRLLLNFYWPKLAQDVRAYVDSHPQDWDEKLPQLLFAYREVPQESTGFSPFELMFGRRVRGPLDLVKERWEEKIPKAKKSVVDYVLSFRERLKDMMSVVQENLAKAQATQSSWYDKTARSRTFELGDKVMVFLPLRSDKLKVAWEGPHVIVDRLDDVTYAVALERSGKKTKVVHVNMLKPYLERRMVLNVTRREEGDEEPDDTLVDVLAHFSEPAQWEELVWPASVPVLDKERILSVLHRFEDVFRKEPGRTTLAKHGIDTGTHGPIQCPPYRVNGRVLADVRREVEEMLGLGVIQPSLSPWAAPVVLVAKPDGSIRFCVDYRKLNSITKPDAYPMPRIDTLLDMLGSARVISTVDLCKGYWQMELEPEARAKSAFITPDGLYEFTVLPFGLRNAPASFQRLVNNLLNGMSEFAVAYIDDIAIFSKDLDSHLEHLARVLGAIQGAGLTIKLNKCQFGMSEVVYLGHRVGSGNITPMWDKVEAIRNWKAPRTKRQVRAFLGMANYYRRFVPDFGTIADPLSSLTKKSLPDKVVWTPVC